MIRSIRLFFGHENVDRDRSQNSHRRIFDAFLTDGGVTITRNGRSFWLRLKRGSEAPKKTLGEGLAMDMSGFEVYGVRIENPWQ